MDLIENSNEHRLLKLMEILPFPIAIHDMEKLVFVNPAFCEMAGVDGQSDLIGKEILTLVHPDDLERAIDSLNLPYYETYFSLPDFRFTFPDGSSSYGDLFGTYVNLNSREYILLTVQNASGMEERRQKKLELQTLKTNFLHTMSHELRTPMIGLIGFGEELREYPHDPAVRNMGEMIFLSAKRLTTTLNGILEFSELESGSYECKPVEFDLIELVREICEFHHDDLVEKPVTLTCSCSHSTIIINSDRYIYKRILENIVGNSIKFTAIGNIHIAVELSENRTGYLIYIDVSDTGPGVDDKEIGLMFEEFRQVSEGINRQYEGSGLGLSIVKHYLKKLGGKVEILSSKGEGSVFRLILPVKGEFSIGEPCPDELFWSSDQK